VSAHGSQLRLKQVDRNWIGAVPEHWDTALLKLVARLESGHTPSRLVPEYWKNCTIPWFTLGDVWQLREERRKYVSETAEMVSELGIANSSARILPAGTVMLSRTASVGFTGIMGREMATTQDFVNWVCGSKVRPEYLWYCLQAMTPEYDRLRFGSTHHTIYMPDVAQFKVPVPPLLEQDRIAKFLDEQTARIDALIAQKQELLERLHEYLEASIARRILGEDQPGPRTKTGVPEVPELPTGWVLSPMMRLTDPKRPIMYGIVLPGPNVEEGPSVPIVKGGDVRPHRLRLELLNRTTAELEAPYARARLAEEDIVYSIRGTIGDAELVPAELAGANITQDVARIAPRAGLDSRWLLFAAKSRPVFAQLEQLSLGAAVRGINIFDLKRARVPTPPLALQRSIAKELAALRARTESLREHCVLHIERLREYRSSLISAAVTGQLEVAESLACGEERLAA
jgi:type I restriction enzyme, S subunit